MLLLTIAIVIVFVGFILACVEEYGIAVMLVGALLIIFVFSGGSTGLSDQKEIISVSEDADISNQILVFVEDGGHTYGEKECNIHIVESAERLVETEGNPSKWGLWHYHHSADHCDLYLTAESYSLFAH
jgi:hypothetical protein